MRKEIGAAKFDQAVASLLVALDSKNPGLTRGAIYVLRELKAENAVIPLMVELRNSADEKTRIAAAYAFCKIGQGVGTFAVKQAVRNTEVLIEVLSIRSAGATASSHSVSISGGKCLFF